MTVEGGLVVAGVTKYGIPPVSFTGEPGEVVTVMGRCRGGKSTVAAMVAGFTKPDAGRVFLNGDDLHALSEAELARRVGWLCATIVASGSRRSRPPPALVVADEPQWRIGDEKLDRVVAGLAARGAIVVVTRFVSGGGWSPFVVNLPGARRKVVRLP